MNHDSYSFKYTEHVEEIFNRIKEAQTTAIDEVVKKTVEATAGGHAIYIFGASHAGTLAQEMSYRIGSLAVINPILPAEFMLNTRPADQTSVMEKLEGYPTVTLNHTAIQEGDVLIPHSVSGRNIMTIEMGIEAGKKGVYTAVIMNMTYTNGATSRHSSGKKLFEACGIYINNCGDSEDSSMLLSGTEQKIVPTSNVTGCGTMNMMEICTVERLLATDVVPPVFHSANVDGGMEFNQVLSERNGEQIHYMRQPHEKIF